MNEIGEVPIELQQKLLNVIQQKKIQPLGEHKPDKVDTRLIAATNRNLKSLVDKKQFRSDLSFRLNVLYIPISPLRDRMADIPYLVHHFLEQARSKYNWGQEAISEKGLNWRPLLPTASLMRVHKGQNSYFHGSQQAFLELS